MLLAQPNPDVAAAPHSVGDQIILQGISVHPIEPGLGQFVKGGIEIDQSKQDLNQRKRPACEDTFLAILLTRFSRPSLVFSRSRLF
jgi:hypothetical protein